MKKNTFVALFIYGMTLASLANAAEMEDSMMMKDTTTSSGTMIKDDTAMAKDNKMMSDTMKKDEMIKDDKMMMKDTMTSSGMMMREDKMMKVKMMFQGVLDKISDAKIKKISGKIAALKEKINTSSIADEKKVILLGKIEAIETVIAKRMSKMDAMMMEDKMMK